MSLRNEMMAVVKKQKVLKKRDVFKRARKSKEFYAQLRKIRQNAKEIKKEGIVDVKQEITINIDKDFDYEGIEDEIISLGNVWLETRPYYML